MLHKVVLYSGDLVSRTLLHRVASGRGMGEHLHAFTFDYGFASDNIRIKLTKQVKFKYSLTHRVIELHSAPEAYRPSILLAFALEHAKQIITEQSDNALLYYGGCADSALPALVHFIELTARMMFVASRGMVQLKAPYMLMERGAILAEGLTAGIDYAQSWDCIALWDQNSQKICGRCIGCQRRAAAFKKNNAIDPFLA